MGDTLILPDFPGRDSAYKRTPLYTTRVQNTPSGREVAVSYESYPRYEWDLKFNALRDYLTVQEAKQLEAFFHALKGRGDYFLFDDPERGTAVAVIYANGTGSNTTARLQAAHIEPSSGIVVYEPVQNAYNDAHYLTDWGHKDQLLSKTARTNRVTYSQELDNAAWGKSNVTVVANNAAAPDGTVTADKMVDNITNAFHYIDTLTYTPADNAVISGSIYVKYVDVDYIALELYSKAGPAAGLNFRFSTKAFTTTAYGGATFSVTELSNGWFKLSINNFNVGTGATAPRLRLFLSNAASEFTYAGDGVRGVLAWGGQIVDGTNSGRYIPTVASAVTQTDITLAASGLVTMGWSLAVGGFLYWSGKFRYRCRLLDDKLPMTRSHSQIWNASFKFRSVKV